MEGKKEEVSLFAMRANVLLSVRTEYGPQLPDSCVTISNGSRSLILIKKEGKQQSFKNDDILFRHYSLKFISHTLALPFKEEIYY